MTSKKNNTVLELTEGVFVVSNFVSQQDIEVFIEFIEAFQHIAISGQEGKRFSIPVGKVPLIGLSNVDPFHKIHKIKFKDFPRNLKNTFNKIAKKTITHAQELFDNKTNVHCSNAIFAKQLPGAKIAAHIDSQPRGDEHLYYSAVLYLNTINDGDIFFAGLNATHHPKAGDLLLFKSNHVNSEHEVKSISEVRYSIPIFLSKDKECYIE